jgi:MFS family permease
MEKTAEKTSTWLALRNQVFRRLWLAMVISGSCIGAHNTAVYWAMHKLGASTLHIALMTTVSALPFTLFTLPAGAIADMVDRKKILLTVQIWHASIAFALAILWMAHLLNPYLILVSAFLFSAGFAFGSPAHASVIAEIVSKDDLASAYTLAGMQMDLSGIIGPLFSALLLPLAGVSFIFGANGLGFLLMFLALLQWKRVKVQQLSVSDEAGRNLDPCAVEDAARRRHPLFCSPDYGPCIVPAFGPGRSAGDGSVA